MFSAQIADSKIELNTRESRSDATSFIQDRVVGDGTTRSLILPKECLRLSSITLPCRSLVAWIGHVLSFRSPVMHFTFPNGVNMGCCSRYSQQESEAVTSPSKLKKLVISSIHFYRKFIIRFVSLVCGAGLLPVRAT